MSLVLTREGLDREILRLAIPAALQNLMLTAIFVVDTKMIAVFAAGDPEPLAALGITGPFVWALSVIFTVTSVGTTALVARRVGEGSPGSASQVAGTAALLALGVGAAVALLGLPLCQPLVAWVTSLVGEGGDPALAADASGYLWWILFFFPLRSLAITLEAALRGAGDSATPLWGGILSNVANVAGNALLIFGLWGFPRMGVAGAGLASALAPGAECLLLGFFLLRGWSPRLRLSLSHVLRFHRHWGAQIVRVSVPALLAALIFHSGFQVYQFAIFGLDEVSVAAHRIAIALQSAAFLPAYGFYISAASLSGRLLGAGDAELARVAAHRNLRLGLFCMMPIAVLFLFGAGPLTRFFTDEVQQWTAAAVCLRIGALEIPFLLATEALHGTLRGAGETREPMVVTALGTWLVRVPFSWGLSHLLRLGLAGIWLATVGDWLVRGILMWRAYRRGRWMEVEL